MAALDTACRTALAAVSHGELCWGHMLPVGGNGVCTSLPASSWPCPALIWPYFCIVYLPSLVSALRRWLEGVEQFDAAAFGIGVSEALLIDPQHRLMLEVGGRVGKPALAAVLLIADQSVLLLTSSRFSGRPSRRLRPALLTPCAGCLGSAVCLLRCPGLAGQWQRGGCGGAVLLGLCPADGPRAARGEQGREQWGCCLWRSCCNGTLVTAQP